ncbi:hypothetical protein K438DRAFT_1782701 [Mycena galopus ATCC 62051]|nr:hypothetical protein K438DRAFT_1782701 [Mycena galopus ATCC 62051]
MSAEDPDYRYARRDVVGHQRRPLGCYHRTLHVVKEKAWDVRHLDRACPPTSNPTRCPAAEARFRVAGILRLPGPPPLPAFSAPTPPSSVLRRQHKKRGAKNRDYSGTIGYRVEWADERRERGKRGESPREGRPGTKQRSDAPFQTCFETWQGGRADEEPSSFRISKQRRQPARRFVRCLETEACVGDVECRTRCDFCGVGGRETDQGFATATYAITTSSTSLEPTIALAACTYICSLSPDQKLVDYWEAARFRSITGIVRVILSNVHDPNEIPPEAPAGLGLGLGQENHDKINMTAGEFDVSRAMHEHDADATERTNTGTRGGVSAGGVLGKLSAVKHRMVVGAGALEAWHEERYGVQGRVVLGRRVVALAKAAPRQHTLQLSLLAFLPEHGSTPARPRAELLARTRTDDAAPLRGPVLGIAPPPRPRQLLGSSFPRRRHPRTATSARTFYL